MGSDLQCFQKCQWYWRDSSRLQWPLAVLPAAPFQKQYSSSINSKCTSGSSKHPSIWSSRSRGGRSFLQLLISSLPHLTLLLPQANQFSEINYLCLKFQARFLFSCLHPDWHGTALAISCLPWLISQVCCLQVLSWVMPQSRTLSSLLGHWDRSKGDPGESTEKASYSFCFLIFP